MARELIECDKDTWTLAAENVTKGVINVAQWTKDNYIQTYVATSDPAPTDDDEAVPFHNDQLLIDSASAIDVYIKCNKDDGAVYFSDSQIYGVVGVSYVDDYLIGRIDRYLHSKIKLYPELAEGITLIKELGAWADFGTPIEIIPENTIVDSFAIRFIDIRNISENGGFTLKLYAGDEGEEVEIATIGFSKSSAFTQEGSQECIMEIQPKNTRISAAISGSPAGASTAIIKLQYQTY